LITLQPGEREKILEELSDSAQELPHKAMIIAGQMGHGMAIGTGAIGFTSGLAIGILKV